MAQKSRIVAELGRPETPDETAARKATASRTRRARQTVNNLWLSLLATVGIVVVIVLLVPRSDGPRRINIDYEAIAAQAVGAVSQPLVVPSVPDGWSSNAAEVRTQTADLVDEWYIGFLTPENEYIGFSQGIDANATWLLEKVEGTPESGSELVGDVRWTLHDNRTADDPGLAEYAMSVVAGANTYVLYGSAEPAEFRVLAESVSAEIDGADIASADIAGAETGATETKDRGTND